MSSKSSDITLYFLNSSRAIRVAWMLEELNLQYKLVRADRAKNGLAPPEFKSQIPNPLGKSPTVQDGDVNVAESGAILEYLAETYDSSHKLLPKDPQTRAKVREWLHAGEGTFMVHAMAILYARWRLPESAQSVLPELEDGLSNNVKNDFKWLEDTLVKYKKSGDAYIVGNELTAADVMLGFTVEFLMERKLGVKGWGSGQYPEVEAWFERVTQRPAYKKAVEKTGYTLDGDFRK